MNEWLGYFEMVVFTYYIVVVRLWLLTLIRKHGQWLVWV